MNTLSADWSKPQRQAPSALVILLFKAVVSLLKVLWPLLLVFILNKKSNSSDKYEYIILGVSILSVLRSVIEYYNFRFSISNDNLIITSGLFTKKTVTLPLHKIQAVHSEQTWVHRLFNVSRISFDSAGSEKMEVKIEALDKLRTGLMKELILSGKSITVIAENEKQIVKEETLITLAPNDLLKLGLSSNHLEAFFLIAAFVYSTLNNAGVSDKEFEGGAKWVYENFGQSSLSLFLFMTMVVLIISIGFSVIRILLTYFDFIISRSAVGFRIKSGFLNKKEKFIPFLKIQFISWKANWIRRRIGLSLLQFHATGTEQMQRKMLVKVPVTREQFISLLADSYHPLLMASAHEAIKIHTAYISRRVFIAGLLPSVLLFPFLYPYFQFSSFFVLLLVGFVWLSAFLFQKKFRLWVDKEALQIKKGVWGRHELILKWNNIQSVQVEQSIYQRKHLLASLHLNTAGGIIDIPFIELHKAREIQNYALYKIETDSSGWH